MRPRLFISIPETHLPTPVLLVEDHRHDLAIDDKSHETLTQLTRWPPGRKMRKLGRRGMSKTCQRLLLDSSLSVERGPWYGNHQ